MNQTARIRITGSDETGRAFDSARSNMDRLRGTAVAASAAIGALAAGFAVSAQRVIDNGDQLQKLSIRIGASTEALSQYQLVADRSGVSFESLTAAWERMGKRAALAAEDMGPAVNAYRELGIEADTFKRLQPDEQFEILADAISGVEDPADRLRLVSQLLGDEGRRLIQVFEGGSSAIQGMRAEADAMGLTLNRVQADQMAAFNDQLTNVSHGVRGAAQSIVVTFMPTLQDMARAVNVGAVELAKFLDGFRAIENQTNLAGLDDQFAELSIKAGELAKEALALREKGWFADARLVEQELVPIREEMDRILERQKELRAPTEVAPVAGFDLAEAGSLPSLSDDRAAEAAAERAAAEQERLREQLAQRIELIRESTLTETELAIEQHEAKLAQLDEFAQAEIDQQVDVATLKEKLETAHQKNLRKIEAAGLTERQKFQRANLQTQLGDVFSHLNTLLEGVAHHNRTLFQINKVAAIADAAISAHEGAARTLGKYPWPLGPALAALHYAAGVARVSAIASTDFGGGVSSGGGGAVSTDLPALPVTDVDPVFGLPETTDPTEPATVQEITINLGDDDQLLSTDAVRNLIEAINEQAADGVLIGSIAVA